MGAGAHAGMLTMTTLRQPHHDVEPTVDHTAATLEQFLAAHAVAGVPEVVLVALLRSYADEIERRGYIPRKWQLPR